MSDRFTTHSSSDGKWLAIYDNESEWQAHVDTDDVELAPVLQLTKEIVELLNQEAGWLSV